MAAHPRPLSLRAKIVLILSSVVVLYAASDHVIQQLLVYRSFVALEEARGRRDIQRVVASITSEIEHLDARCAEWAARDDTYRFVSQPYPEYLESNLAPGVFANSGVDLLYICGPETEVDVPDRTDALHKQSGMPKRDRASASAAAEDGALRRQGIIPVVWGRIVDPITKSERSLVDFPIQALASQNPLIVVHDPARSDGFTLHERGILLTEAGPMLVSSKPIRDSARTESPRGTLIMGRFLAGNLLARLMERTKVDISLWNLEDPRMPERERTLLDEVTSSSAAVVRTEADGPMYVYATLSDIREAPAILMRANVVRDISSTGATAVRYALVSTVAAGLLMMLVLLFLLQRTVLKPIARLTAHAVEIGKSEDFSKKLELDRDDEIGILSREFDGMMEKLAQSRAAIVKAARAAGMSEIATGVLHNVGNVLNSVNVSAALVADKARNSGAQDFKRVIEEVRTSAGDLATFLAKDPRGEHLYPLLASLADQLEFEQRTIESEVRTLTQGIEHIKDLIQSQQDYAGRSGVLETVSLAEQIENALAMTGQTVQGAELEIVREYEGIAPCAVDRHRLMEILVNLIQNARQSLQAPDVAERRLCLRLRSMGAQRARFEVADSGVGILPENLARIFTHGFTTKKTGHGFGLHASANAATEMGGKLFAESAGPGRGATFILELPIRKLEPAGVAA